MKDVNSENRLDKRPRRLLFVVNVAWFFISHRLPLAIAAIRNGMEVHVASALEGERDRDSLNVLRNAGIHFHQLEFSRRGDALTELWRDFSDVRRLFQELEPDLVHLVTLKPNLIGGIAARFSRVPRVIIAISGRGSVFSISGLSASLRRLVALSLYRFAYRPNKTKVIVQNREDRDYFIKRRVFGAEDVCLIRGSGVDVDAFLPSPEPDGKVCVLFAGRMLREKGVVDFVSAARTLKEQGVDARFVLVGDADHGNPLSLSRSELESWVAVNRPGFIGGSIL